MDKLKEELTYEIRKVLLEQYPYTKDIGVINFIDIEVKQVDTVIKGYVNNHYYSIRDIKDKMENELTHMWDVVTDLGKNGIKLHTGAIKNSEMMFDIQGLLHQIQEHKEDEVTVQKGIGMATVNAKQFMKNNKNRTTVYDIKFECEKEGDGQWSTIYLTEIKPYEIPF